MSKSDAASALLGICIVGMVPAVLLTIGYGFGFGHPDNVVRKAIRMATYLLFGSIPVAIVGFIAYCIYVLIA